MLEGCDKGVVISFDQKPVMIKFLSVPAAFVGFMLACVAVCAQAGKAPCGSFQKLTDGKWNVLKPVKIEHGNQSAILRPGTAIVPGTVVAGVDIYAALQKNCH